MPLGWESINAKKSGPNKNVVFIKPRPGPDEATSKDYLERIAAQCLPIMNKHHLAVVSLEEYEPNHEFWGRNFNNGEVIQLVLKSSSTGHWLPFKFVQMVMMHELAHNKAMNHLKEFWDVRNEYTTEMKMLWDDGYTGEGLWGRGVLLENGKFARETLEEGEILPEHMCGGTFRSRGGQKRKVKPKITYEERQERRIKKKFGENGMALGADDEVKATLEKGKRPAGKPRVAKSQRGRELRAAAALARFETVNKEEEPQIKDADLVTDDETETESDSEVFIKSEPDDAVDINGQRLLDRKGHGMVRVCEEEDEENSDAQRELQELRGVSRVSGPRNLAHRTEEKTTVASASKTMEPKERKGPATIAKDTSNPVKSSQQNSAPPKPQCPLQKPTTVPTVGSSRTTSNNEGQVYSIPSTSKSEKACPICSVHNEPMALTCVVCANVLEPEFVAGSWRCKCETCNDGLYVNAGDVNICGVCGTRKCSDGT